MTKGATEVAASVGDEEKVTAEAMLRSLTFQQRLDQARAQRERALQAKGADELSPATLSKPWEKPTPAPEPADAPPPSRRLERTAPTLFFPAGSAPPAPVANLTDPSPKGQAATPLPAPLPAPRRTLLPKSGFVRTAIGFSLGLGIGLGIALLGRQPAPTTPTALPAPAAESATGIAAGPANPPDDQGALTGTVAVTSVFAEPAQTDVPLVTPAAADVRAMPSQASAPTAAAPEAPPAQPAAFAGVPPQVWWPADARLPSTTEEAALPVPSRGPETMAATGLPPQIGPAPEADIAPRYGKEARQPPPADPLPLYSGVSVKILGAATANDPVLTTIAATLGDAGFPAPDIGHVSYKISQTHVRFYHVADEAAANVIARRLGVEARDFSQTAPPPPKGLIEVWVAPPSVAEAGSRPPAAALPKPAPVKAAAKKKSAAKKPVPPPAPAAPAVTEEAEAAQVKARILLMLLSGGSP